MPHIIVDISVDFLSVCFESSKEECKKCEKLKQKLPEPPNRVEFVPIEWYSKVRSPNHSLMTSLNAVTLRSIPALRSIANDVVFDVLMYLTPEFCGGKRAANLTICVGVS